MNTKADGTVIDSYSYTYDAAHNQSSKTDSKGVTRYEYDSLNRLQKVTEPDNKVTTYLFDKAGNRVQETVIAATGSVTTTYEYNEQNRLTNTLTRTGAVAEKVTYEYDNNGNTLVKVKETTRPVEPDVTGSFAFNKAGMSTVKEVTFMEYNVWNQMVETIEGDKTIQYRYNGEGYRVEKRINGETTKYLYEADKVILELDGQGNQAARNLYGTNLLMRVVAAEQYYYMYNGHGDVTALIGTDGTIAAQYYYDAFGSPMVEGTNENEIDNPIRYAGYQWDGETEIYYLNARYYDPKIARFLTEDTYRGEANDPLTLNLYMYCANSPIMYIDPTGHAFTTWDNEHVTNPADRKAILDATKEWADAKTDAERKAAHDKAEKARDKYRGTEYEGSDDGTTYKKDADRDKEHKELLEGAILSDSDGLYRKKDTDKVSNDKSKDDKIRLSSIDIFATALGVGNRNMSVIMLPNADKFLPIVKGDLEKYYGGNQMWYTKYTQRQGGCGPTAAANIAAYLALYDPNVAKLFNNNGSEISRENFVKLMNAMYKYVNPNEIPVISTIDNIRDRGIIIGDTEISPTTGVWPISKFAEGLVNYAKKMGVKLEANAFDNEDLSITDAVNYIKKSLRDNSPVALFNAFDSVDMVYNQPNKNPTQTTNYDFKLHWVTITAMSTNKATGETTVVVSTWGGQAFINLNDVWQNKSKIASPGIVFFNSK